MSDIDAVLRDAFARAAEPGDPAGVVDAIRARMAAGDTGTPATTSGFGARIAWFWPYLILAVVLGVVGGVLGASGVFTAADAPLTTAPIVTVTETATAPPTPTPTPIATATATPTAEPTETAPPVVAPVADTTGPQLSTPAGSPDEVSAADTDAPSCAITSLVSAVATDNVAVVGIHITWTGVESGMGEMTSGASWTFSFNPADTTPTGNVTFTLVARDAAGNTSAPVTTTVKVWDYCLI